MKISLAENYGFCFGVKRAIKIAEENQDSRTYGPLIHNAKEIERLHNDFNVGLTENLSDFHTGETAVIRTHGIPKEELEKLHERQVDVIDATCPYVTKPQQICEEMSKEGYDIVIFGDEDHPEIKGVKSYADGNVYTVLHVKDLESIHLKEKIAIVAQTTRKVEEFLAIANYLIIRHKEVRVFNTICNATFENQDAVKDLAKKSDVMIIIGGKNSSNTKQLQMISLVACSDSYHIESPDEINSQWFIQKKNCGISAGASTPDWIIKDVIAKIESITNK
ncbi:MAG: 4-hydroxy-3-methylbut-2-enyl diphosphate reductase [Campylobacterota bacterium]|nr:4-hydroxy-3-methylbut-2-enyl diphosphate reductase [Campylobacterota bacterium]